MDDRRNDVASSSLRERDAAVDAIRQLLGSARSGSGSATFLTGDPGVGKSALLAAARRLAGRELTVRSARGAPLETGLPYAFAEQFLDAPLVSDRSPDIAELPARRAALYDLARAQVRAWASAAPVLVLLDDLHWADPDSLHLIDFLVRRLAPLPVAVVGALRPWPPEAAALVNALAHQALATVHSVPTLSRAATAGLLGDLTGAAVTPSDRDRAFALSGGNPLLVTEVARGFLDQGRLPVAEGQDGAGLRQVLLLSHLAGLPPAALDCARALAVLGGRSPLGVVEAVSTLPADEFTDALDALVRAGVLRGRAASSAEFSHDLLSTAIYEDTAPAHRRRLHERAFRHYADSGEPSAAAPHALAAELRGDPQAVAALVAAGLQALTKGAVQVALTRLDAAVAFAADAASDELLLRRADTLLAVGRAETAGAAYRDLLGRPLDSAVRREVSVKMARARAHTGDVEEALAVLDTLPATDGGAAIAGRLERAHVLWERDGPPGALAALPATGEVAEPEPIALARAYFQLQAGDPSGLDGLRRAALSARHALSAKPGQALPSLNSITLYASACGMTDRLAEGLRLIERSDDWLRARGALWSTLPLRLTRLGILLDRGELLAVTSGADDIEEEFELDALTRPHVQLFRARALVWLGRAHEADEICTTVQDTGGSLPWYAALALSVARGDSLLVQQRPEEAADVYSAVEDMIARFGVGEPCTPRWAASAIEAALWAGRRDQAERVIGWLEQRNPALPCVWPKIVGSAGRGGLAAADGDDARADELFRAALALADALPLDHARILLRYGSWLRRGGNLPAARTALDEAVRIATAIAAEPLAGRARTELSAAGGRRRRRGDARLTAQESRVAGLAATGATTREIAQELHVSPRTVETHLAHAYGKLGVRSKVELRRRSAELDLGTANGAGCAR